MRFSAAPIVCLSSLLTFVLTGCSLSPTASPVAEAGMGLRGNVHGGQQPVANAHVYLFAANTTGYGQPSVSLLNSGIAGTYSDANGVYVLTDQAGDFSISGDYSCTPSTQVYLLALGGDPGAGLNPASGIMAVLGSCPSSQNFASSISFIIDNELSTVAAAYSIAGFATDSLHVSSSGTALAQIGIANAFANAANLESLGGGIALTITPGGNGVVPRKTLNTLGNILAACINSTGPSSVGCTTLFGNALSGGTTGTAPTDTASAAINIAHNPGANVANLYYLPAPTAPFFPGLRNVPNDFSVTLTYTGGGLDGPSAIAIDGAGSVWTANYQNGAIAELASSGVPLSSALGYNPSTAEPVGIAIDRFGNAWVADAVTSSLMELSSSGALMSPSPLGFTGGGLGVPQGVAVDGGGNIWAANYLNTVSEFASSGTPLSPTAGYVGGGLNGPGGIAIDSDGSIWIPNTSSSGTSGISKFSTYGTPLSPASGFLGGGADQPFSIAIDQSGHAWAANIAGNTLTELANDGAAISPSSGFAGGGLNLPFAVAIDGAGSPWVANYGNNTVSHFSSAGVPISPSTGYAAGLLVSPQAIAIDPSGNVWIANGNDVTVTELVGAATPVVTPLAVAIRNNQLGSRP